MWGGSISILFCGVALVLMNSGFVNGDSVIWNFGVNVKGSYVVGRETGRISALEKTKRIPLNVPKCHKVTSVRVEVENSISTPSVRYEEDSNVVTISYTLLSISLSTYDVLVKGRKIPGCGGGPPSPPAVQCLDVYGKRVACDYDDYYS